MTSLALVTKSYRGDFELCRDLCASVDRHMPAIPHYLLVDRADRQLFAPLASSTRTIVPCDALLPQFREIDLPGRRLWWQPPWRFVRGWIHQQLAKIAFVAGMVEDAAVHIDSDITFIAPLPQANVFEGGRVRLLRNPGGGQAAQHDRWHRIAQQLLSLPVTGYSGCDYIGPGVVWSPAQVRAMISRIEHATGMQWFDALAHHFRFSEYLLYGNFCDHVADPGGAPMPSGDWRFCHMSWGHDFAGEEGIERFVAALGPQHACVLIQSNLGLSHVRRAAIMRRIELRRKQFGR